MCSRYKRRKLFPYLLNSWPNSWGQEDCQSNLLWRGREVKWQCHAEWVFMTPITAIITCNMLDPVQNFIPGGSLTCASQNSMNEGGIFISMFKDEQNWDSETTGSHCQTRVKPEFEPSSAGFHTLSNQAKMTLAQNPEGKDFTISDIDSIKHQLQDIFRNLNAKALRMSGWPSSWLFVLHTPEPHGTAIQDKL